MPKIQEIARLTIQGQSHTDDGTTASQAHLVHLAIRARIDESGPDAAVQAYEGIPGFRWTGSVNEIIRSLWPVRSAIRDSMGRSTLGLEINTYLRNTRNAVCTHRGGVERPSTWWIRDIWSATAPPPNAPSFLEPTRREQQLSAHEAGEDRTPAPVETHFKTITHEEGATDAAASTLPPTASTAPTPTPEASFEPYRCPQCNTVIITASHASQHRALHAARAEILEAARIIQDEGQPLTYRDLAGVAKMTEADIRRHFSTLAQLERAVGKYLAAEAPAPAPAPQGPEQEQPVSFAPTTRTFDTDGEFPCRRGCARVFGSDRGRAQHESAHGTLDTMVEATRRLYRATGEVPTLQMVAAEVGVHATAVYSYFHTAEEFFGAALEGAAPGDSPASTPTPTPVQEQPVPSPSAPDEPQPALPLPDALQLIIAVTAQLGFPLSRTVLRMVAGSQQVTTADVVTELENLTRSGAVVQSTIIRWRGVEVYLPGPHLDPSILTAVDALTAVLGGRPAPELPPVAPPLPVKELKDVTAAVPDPLDAVRALVDEVERSRTRAQDTERQIVAAIADERARTEQERVRAEQLQTRLAQLRSLLSDESVSTSGDDAARR